MCIMLHCELHSLILCLIAVLALWRWVVLACVATLCCCILYHVRIDVIELRIYAAILWCFATLRCVVVLAGP